MKSLYKFMLIVILSLTTLISKAYGGEILSAGTILQEESYVFTMPEAQRLMSKVKEMESQIENQQATIDVYKELDQNQQKQILENETLINIKQLQISEYKNLHDLDSSRIKKLERQSNVSNFERWGFLGLGVGITIGSVLIADKIDDVVEGPIAQQPRNTTARGVTLFRF